MHFVSWDTLMFRK